MGEAAELFEQLVQQHAFKQTIGPETVHAARSAMSEWSGQAVDWNDQSLKVRVFTQTCIQVIMDQVGLSPIDAPPIMIQISIAIWRCAIWMFRHFPDMVDNDPSPQQPGRTM